MALSNADIARVFSQLAVMLELDGADSFRVRAYREGARVVESLAEPLAALAAAEDGLDKLPGIGKRLAQHIRELLASGTTPLYDEMKARFPVEMVELTELQGLGPKRVRQVFDALGVKDRASLEAAARAGQLRELPGFGEKLEKKILQSLAYSAEASGRLLLGGVWALAEELAARLRKVAGVQQVEIAGSFRRRRDTVGDLDLLVTGGATEAVMESFVTSPGVADVLGRGDTKSSVRLTNGLQVDVRHVPPEAFGAALLYFTGSKAHNIELRRIAIDKGMSLNEYGLTRGERTVAARTEDEIYRALDLAWIPPELRENTGEIVLAREGRLPKLIELEDLVADLHLHTDRTDGRDTLEAMVRAVKARGYAYCAITDHSKSLAMANGFNAARVRQSVGEIEAVRRAVPGIHVLHGLEVDILADGSLDLEEEGLELLDWVIVSLHQQLDQPPAEATERVLRALDHPRVMAMAHPTGRIIGTRPGAKFDLERVCERAVERGVALEINSHPDRSDLSDVNARFAKEKGARFVIDTDAHSVRHLDNIRFGVFAARRAGIEARDVLNTLPFERFRAALRRPGVAQAPGARAPVPAGTPGPGATPRAKTAATKPAASSATAGRAGARAGAKSTAARPTAPKPAGRGPARPSAGTAAGRGRPKGGKPGR